jgi:DNA repair exonuclease SbcCD ATPase subunit
MMKISSINIKGIRGVKNKLPLDLNKKSILIFGENGSGKSSISDAIEWFYSDSIEHISSEEIEKRGKGAIRNKFIDQNDDAYVDIKFSDNSINSIKSIDDSARTYNSNTNNKFKDYISVSQSERLILRYHQLLEFIIATKKEKLDKLQEIIGFSEVGKVRDLLRKIAGKIKRSIKSEQFQNQKDAKQSTLIENLSQPTYTNSEFIEACNELIKPLKLGKKIKTISDVKKIIKEIEQKEDNKTANLISFYGRIAENLKLIKDNLPQLHAEYEDFYNAFSLIQKEPDKIKKLKLSKLLNEGVQVLKTEIVKEDICPLCLQTKKRIELIKELNERLEELAEINEEKEELDKKTSQLENTLLNNSNRIKSLLNEKLFGDKEHLNLKQNIQKIEIAFDDVSTQIKKDVSQQEELKEPKSIKIPTKDIEELIESAQDKAKELTESQKKNVKLQIYTKLFRANEAFLAYLKIEKKEKILTKQQETFELLFADFIRRQEEAINSFLNQFSGDINDFYCIMNPNEKVQNIKLVPIKDRNTDDLLGITIEYDFYNTTTTQPIAYLSESHLNCLGLSFFLASVKAFNKKTSFFILDDVVSSYDRSHRTRFAKLLIDKFNDDFQIILLTHEQEFFELISSTIKSKGWQLQEIGWNKDDGSYLKTAQIDYKSQIENKINKRDKDELGNLIRKYLERQLKTIANNLEAKVIFKFNDLNEKRMAPELLDSLQSTLNKHSKELKDKADIHAFKGIPAFIANTTSHDNTFQVSIEDLEFFWEETGKLIKLFYCNSCNRYISVKNIDKANKKISCGCPNLNYDWKE